jgi:hypothetical protein
MNVPDHHLTEYKNQITQFSGPDSQEHYEYNLVHNLTRLEEIGFDHKTVTYRHNAEGFRTDEFDQRESSIALGCSFTQGVGLPEELVWPMLLSNKLNHYVWNLGVGGCSVDTCYRIAKHYVNYLNVKNVFLLGPPEDRFEYYRIDKEHYGLYVYLPSCDEQPNSAFFKGWVMSNEFREVNYAKNLDAISNVCSTHNVNFYYLYSGDVNDPGKKARDLMHPGIKYQQNVANMFYEKFLTK